MTFLLYKPFGMLSQFSRETQGQTTLADLDFELPKNVWPVGRLDADSEGALILTDDKSLIFKLLDPKNHVPKTYWACVEGLPTEADLEKFRRGLNIKIDGKIHRTRPARARLLAAEPLLPPRLPPIRFRKSVPDSWLEIELVEGKNRQVRRMCAAIGFPVLRLVRAAIGPHRLGDLAPGAVRRLD